MSVLDFLSDLRRLGIKLWDDGEGLRYQAPKGVVTPSLRTELIERKTELLAFLRQAQISSAPIPSLPTPRASHGPSPLSFSQQRLWFLDQLGLDCTVYNLGATLALRGRLNIPILQSSLEAIVNRHDSLRTTFPVSGGKPQQVVASDCSVRLSQVDLRQVAAAEQEVEVWRLTREELQKPFDLARGPLWRFTLFVLAEAESLLFMAIHHIGYDGWSHHVFIRELSAYYDALSNGSPLALPDLPIQYADYAAWQHEPFQDQSFRCQVEYWRQKLAGSSHLLDLPKDGERQARDGSTSDRYDVLLTASLAGELKKLSQQESATLFMTLLAAFRLLLYRYTSQEDLVIGSSVAGRQDEAVDHLIGLFVNVVALRTRASGELTFRELLAHVYEVCSEAYDHQSLPFEKLVEELHPERDLNRNPLFQVFFNFLNFNLQPITLKTLKIEPIQRFETQSKFDLTLEVREQNDQLWCGLIYESTLFDRSRIEEMLEQFRSLLHQLVANPNQPIRSYTLVTTGANTWLPDPSLPLCAPAYPLVTDLVASWATRMPDHPAIQQGHESWSYGELVRRAEALAQLLVASEVKPGDVVAIYSEKGFGLYASMLGVMMSGGAFLTIDPALPVVRQQFMLHSAEVRYLVITDRQHLSGDVERLERDIIHTIWLDSRTGRVERPNLFSNLDQIALPKLEPESPAYVIFTSGTTGAAKGIVGCHKGLAHFLAWQRDGFDIGPQDRCTQLTGISFDGVLRDVFLPLTSGASLCVPDGRTIEADYLLPWLERHDVSILHAVPTMVQSWLHDVPQGIELKSLRWVFFVGEPLMDTLVTHWREMFPAAGRVVNFYGSTETTLVKCFDILPDQLCSGVQPVGHALPGSQALVLNTDGQLCGVGEAGEIVLRTPFRTLGYLGETAASEERLVPNPFGDDPQDIVHFTGDRGRYRPDGRLEMIGRLDHQVKIQGVRVEPDEVTAVLGKHPLVCACVVVAQQTHQAGTILVGYVVTTGSTSVTVSELRLHLQRYLPAVMIPAAFVYLDVLPHTPNGKIDRDALPLPDATRPLLEAVYVAPRTPVEDVLCGIWASLLDVEQVGVFDNFFELGGHSLLAVQVMSRVREALAVELSLRTIFEVPTVAHLAQCAEAERMDGPATAIPEIQPTLREGRGPLSFAQQRLWFLEQLQPERAVYNLPFAWRLSGRLHVRSLEKSLDGIVQRHDVLRMTFVTENSHPVAVVTPSLSLALRVIDLQIVAEADRSAEVQRKVVEESQHRFDVAEGPLVRAMLIKMAADDYILLITFHHMVFDDWSVKVFWDELAAFYAAYDTGKPAQLPQLPVQYGDFATWQRQMLQGDRLNRQLAYWKQQLADCPSVLELPTDRPRPLIQTFRGARHTVQFDQELTHDLYQLSRHAGVTLFMTLFAAFQTLLIRYTGARDVLVGTPVTDRTRIEVEHLLGFFVNTLVLRVQLRETETFSTLVQRVREVVLGAYEQRELPFEKLVEVLQPVRDPSRSPLFQVMFAFQNSPAPNLNLPGLDVEPMVIDSYRSRFDLTLVLREVEGQITGVVEYSSDLFDGSTIARLADHLQTVLRGMVAHPEQSLSTLPLLSEAERYQVVVVLNDTSSAFADDLCIHRLFESAAAQYPEAIAVTDGKQHVTYEALNRRADHLANGLRVMGVGPDQRVGLFIERSVQMLVGVLGILKAGGAYVPLEVTYPESRLAFMVADAQLSIVLTQQSLLNQVPVSGATIRCVDEAWNLGGELVLNSKTHTAQADHLAYVLYTSGSTGPPKGVMISHRSLANYLQWCVQAYVEPNGAGAPVHGSLSFDATMTSLLVPLLVGQCVRLAPVAPEFEAIHAVVHDARHFSFVKLTPAHLALLNASTADVVGTRTGKTLVLGGEALMSHHVQNWQDHAPHVRLINEYGPTEATIGCCVYDVPHAPRPSGAIPIGRPIWNTQLYILDRQLQVVPIGVVGELYIGGLGLARGYLNQPEWTAARFIPNPYSKTLGARLYKSGDQARYLPDGNIEFVGRLDQQVKVRGFRIELDEIATVLVEHPEIQDAVVIRQAVEIDDHRLVAYVVSPVHWEPQGWRQFLNSRLPDYMIPSQMVILSAWPLTPNGKVDREVLPRPEWGQAEQLATDDLLRMPIEQTLATVWKEVLPVSRVGLDDNFFDLGGHSLLLVDVHRRLETLLPHAVSLLDLFTYPTISTLTAYIEQMSEPPSEVTFRSSRAESRRTLTNRRRQSGQRRKPLRGD